MARQSAFPGQRSTTDDMNLTLAQTVQNYETPGDRNAAFGDEPIPDTQLTTVSAPEGDLDENRWQRRNIGDDGWEDAFLPPALNIGWDRHIVVPNRSNPVAVTARVVLNQPVPAGVTYTFEYKTTDGTATAAENDYTAVPWTTVTLSAGDEEHEIEITVLGKGTNTGPPETFYLDLRNPSEGSDTFGLGTRMRIDLPGDDTPIVLMIADATDDEGKTLTNRVTASREAAGDITFQYSTAKGDTNPAPDSVYTQVAGATGTIREGATFVDLPNRSNEVNENVFIAAETYKVVIDPTSLDVDDDTFATTGHDLTAINTVTRNQVVTPNITANRPPARTGPLYADTYVRNTASTVTVEGRRLVGFSARTTVDLTAAVSQSRASDNATWPWLVLRGSLSAASVVDAHWFFEVQRLFVIEKDRSIFNSRTEYVLGSRTGRIDVARGDTTWHAFVNYMPRPTDASAFNAAPQFVHLNVQTASFYSKSTYDYLVPRYVGLTTTTTGRNYVTRIRFYNPQGIMVPSGWGSLRTPGSS